MRMTDKVEMESCHGSASPGAPGDQPRSDRREEHRGGGKIAIADAGR